MDGLSALGTFSVDELSAELARFKGYRGIIQARAWRRCLIRAPSRPVRASAAALAGCRSATARSARSRSQVRTGGYYLSTWGCRGRRFGGEYDGEEFHGEREE